MAFKNCQSSLRFFALRLLSSSVRSVNPSLLSIDNRHGDISQGSDLSMVSSCPPHWLNWCKTNKRNDKLFKQSFFSSFFVQTLKKHFFWLSELKCRFLQSKAAMKSYVLRLLPEFKGKIWIGTNDKDCHEKFLLYNVWQFSEVRRSLI